MDDKVTGDCGCCGNGNPGDDPKPLPHWSYSGPTGPEYWGDLDPGFSVAKTGHQQSPIDLAGPFDSGAERIFFTYQVTPLNVTNNGHSIQVDCPPGNSISIGGRRYELLQYHFHTPSEHTADGKYYGMELHLVHQSDQGQFAVVGVFMKAGNTHSSLADIWDLMPDQVGNSVSSEVMIDPTDFLPTDRRNVQYDGSLTTPPCSEDVVWTMMLEPISVSPEQIEQFKKVIGQNNRPVQPLNDRVLRYGA